MPIKQVLVLVDDFSSNSVELYDNVTLYDYGTWNIFREWDFTGDGSVDYYENLTNYSSKTFLSVQYDSAIEWSLGIDRDYAFNSGSVGNYDYTDYSYFISSDQSSDSSIQHGDWTLYALQSQLENPDEVEIILIDVDVTDEFDEQVSKVFEIASNYIGGRVQLSTQIEYILDSWLRSQTALNPTIVYVPTVFSISIAGRKPTFDEAISLATLELLNIAIVQSAPNVGQGFYDWGTVFSDVINVGAWNVDETNEPLWSSVSTLSTVDIFANGYIEKSGWGSGTNFGTSFATPRVAAEISNFWSLIWEVGLARGLLTEDDILSGNWVEYSDLVEILVKAISEDVFFKANDFWYETPKKVLKDDVTSSPFPTIYPITIAEGVGWSGITLNDASYSAFTNSLPLTYAAVITINEDTTYSGTLEATDVDDDELTFSLVGNPNNGVVILSSSGSYTYTPDANYHGSDSFSYKVNDGSANSEAAEVSITIRSQSEIGGAGNDILRGYDQNEMMIGGAGDDMYYVDGYGDRVIELSAGGSDTVYSSISLTLKAYSGVMQVEDLTLQGSSNLNGYGNDLDNTITGNSGNNVLRGYAGNDVLVGGLGQDSLYLGSDNELDRVVFGDINETNIGAQRDSIYQFDTAKDLIDLSLIDANTAISGDQAFKYSGTTEQANSVWTIRSGSSIIVRGDVNGDTTQDFEIMVVGVESLSIENFIA